ncbi:hypothetical protein [Actinocrispum wychmicini]|uniref:CDP-glycerol:poly(Glycerophosphate) glycerophosphotransferase n=1 Tax=Actinocrispum wychmicini TaxID=1213861 RepID=A0A4R2JYZ3_9PSEU|nr:hypothetical protein [Actinocrispum wychmicini]TCO62499.1 hypothetical protein EV192_102637 [Actinocrispum wychmicini]
MHEMWVKGPFGVDAVNRLTRGGCRMVLVMIPSMTAGTRLMDLVPLLAADHRVQTVFTVPHAGETWHGAAEFLDHHGCLTVPWHQARQHTWDLILTASHRQIEQVRGRMLILPHGAGNLMSRRYSRKAGVPARPSTGLDAELLTFRGRVIPTAIALTHDTELKALRRSCPAALPTAVIAGDICLDRMVASTPYREQYRAALGVGVGVGDTLVTVSSTWSATSTFGCRPELYSRLLDESRGARVKVAAVLHPLIWAVHGTYQVRLWLADAIRRGLMVIPPHDGWQATMIAADHVIGDHGSTTSYAAAIGRPVHLAAFPDHNIRSGSIAAATASVALRLRHDRSIIPQLESAAPPPAKVDRVSNVMTSRPGQAAKTLRTTMYRLLDMTEPVWPPPMSAVATPRPLWR